MSLTSMTGYADRAGSADGVAWTWEARSVNGRGLDLRVRLPEGFESLDAVLRQQATATLARGTVTVGLRVARSAGAAVPQLRPEALAAAVAAARAAEAAAAAAGLDLAPVTAADLLGLRGVMEADALTPAETPGVLAGARADIAPLLAALAAARAGEGAALAATLGSQLDRVAGLTAAARESADARATRTGALLRSRLEAVLAAVATVDEGRLAQELALIAVKADVTEELDRLEAHVAAARGLVAAGGAVGRRLDFLMQEFNREANTLCAKSGSSELTAIGLELKVIVDQMREQVQNVE
ncbi:MAG TPA: YicC/YloC family endoribonuclease [Amaricoccus sp.]|nr:YicC/YloC family endoribonuclease [Amaricoccus sp.]